MQTAWCLMVMSSILFFLFEPGNQSLSGLLIESASKSIQLSIELAGSCAFFCGIMKMAEKADVTKRLIQILRPTMNCLFPGVTNEDARVAIAENISSNILGLGNAATPAGIRASAALAGKDEIMSDALCMFLVMNTSSLQLFPSTVVALRSAAGSVSPADILLPSLCATTVSTAVGIVSCLVFRSHCRGKRNGR